MHFCETPAGIEVLELCESPGLLVGLWPRKSSDGAPFFKLDDQKLPMFGCVVKSIGVKSAPHK